MLRRPSELIRVAGQLSASTCSPVVPTNHALEQGSSLFTVVRSDTMRANQAAYFVALFVVNATPVTACGMDKTFKIYVQESYHADKVPLPATECTTKQGRCSVSGTVYIVSTTEAKYAVILADGIEGALKVGKSYSAFLLCQKRPVMIPESNHGKPIAAFYVLEQGITLKGPNRG